MPVVRALSKDGEELGNFTVDAKTSNSTTAFILGAYTYVSFGSFDIPTGTYKVELSLSNQGSAPVTIDALSFAIYESSSASLVDSIFFPFELISPEASNCHLCYDALNLNFCTEQKSNILGDCSYMTEYVNKAYEPAVPEESYFGKEENIYAKEYPWESQSLQNSLLFCELYATEQTCTDPESFVNAHYGYLHPYAGETLCKWDAQRGCFKDSNNDDLSDTILGGFPTLRYLSQYITDPETYYQKYAYSAEQAASLDSSYSRGVSDFAAACDSLPPNAYALIYGTRAGGQKELLTSGGSETVLVGSPRIYMELSDAEVYACEEFSSVSKAFFIDFYVKNEEHPNGVYDYKIVEGNQHVVDEALSEYFVDVDGNKVLTDGLNSLSFRVVDSSGNLAYEKNFELDVDNEGPEIKLVDPALPEDSNTIESVVGPKQTFKYQVTDRAGVDFCSYFLESTGGASQSFYNQSTGNLSGEGESFSLQLPIYNSSEEGDSYRITVTCYDIFGQNSSLEANFVVDAYTNFIVVAPAQFVDFNTDSGFLASSFDFHAVSTDSNLESCSLNFGTNLALTVTDFPDGFTDSGASGTFYKNITGTGLSLGSEKGIVEGSVTCTDSAGNSFTEPLRYFYDPDAPLVESYILNSSSSQTKVFAENGSFFTNAYSGLYFDLLMDGTYSPIDVDSVNLTPIDEEGEMPFILTGISFSLEDTEDGESNDSVKGHASLRNFITTPPPDIGGEDEDLGAYSGIPYLINGVDYGLKQMKYMFRFSDKAGNVGSQELSFIYDASHPKFEFGGDISYFDGERLYTSSSTPTIEVSFGSAPYRTFSCEVQGKDSATELPYLPVNFSRSSKLTLAYEGNRMKDVHLKELEEGKVAKISFYCTDDFGVTLEGVFDIIYDNTPPVLNKISFDKTDHLYYPNGEYIAYPDYLDKVVFDLGDTGEIGGYSCEFTLTSPESSIYTCDGETRNASFEEGETTTTGSWLVLADTEVSNEEGARLCYRSEDFYDIQEQHPDKFETEVLLEGKCTDRAGFETETLSFTLPIDYVSGGLAALEFRSEGGKIYPRILATDDSFDTLWIVKDYDEYLSSAIWSRSSETFEQMETGIYALDSSQSLDLSSFTEDGEYTLYAIALDSDNKIYDSVSATLEVEQTPPNVSLRIPDAFGGVVYSTEFALEVNASDNKELALIELYLQGFDEPLYSSESSNYSELLSAVDIICTKTSCSGDAIFKNASVGDTLSFVLRAVDQFGNEAFATQTVTVSDDFALILLNTSEQSYVGKTGFEWITRKDAPVVAFKTSKRADSCRMYPMIDDAWKISTGNLFAENVFVSASPNANNEFVFDLSGVEGYDLSSVDVLETEVIISCSYEGEELNFTREIHHVLSVPDYELFSEDGFYITDAPYESKLTVKNLGPFPGLFCTYSLGGGEMQDFSTTFADVHEKVLSFADVDQTTLKLECEAPDGMKGPLKEYVFRVDKTTQINLVNVSLLEDSLAISPIQNTFTVEESKSYGLKLLVNKQGLQCKYVINSDSGFLQGFINFFKNIFSLGRKEIPASAVPYEFVINSGLSFTEESELIISCSGEGLETGTKTFAVKFSTSSGEDENETSVGITSITGIN